MTMGRKNCQQASALADVGLLLLRVGVGGSLFAHGAQKLFGWFGGGGLQKTGEAFEQMGFVPGDRNALLAGLGEAGSGALLVLGAATGAAGAGAVGTMTVAASVHAPQGYFATNGGYELPVNNALAAAALALTGPGRFSVDCATGGVLNRPWMRLAAFAASLSTAAALISQRQSRLRQGDSPAPS
jgi:putative oxidoreductase